MNNRHILVALTILSSLSCQKDEVEETEAETAPPPATLERTTGLPADKPNGYDGFPKAYVNDTGDVQVSSTFLEMPKAGDQGNLGSCGAWAIAYGLKSHYRKMHCGLSWLNNSGDSRNEHALNSPSFLFNRAVELLQADCTNGGYISDYLTIASTDGICTMSTMETSDCSDTPNNAQRSNASRNTLGIYSTIPLGNANRLKHALVDGYPIVIAAHLNMQFHTCGQEAGGRYVWNDAAAEDVGQYHAMLVYGFDDDAGAFKVLNSWGTGFKNSGSIWIAYDLFDDQTIDQAYIVEDGDHYCDLSYPGPPLGTPDAITYPTIELGSQVWMAENLRTGIYRNMENIPQDTDWCSIVGDAWCYQNNDPSLDTVYGKLYNWQAINDPRGLCPNGWHVPSLDEWKMMHEYVTMQHNINVGNNFASPDWGWPIVTETNVSGFSAMPAGRMTCTNGEVNFGTGASFWTSTNNGFFSWFFWVGPYPGFPAPHAGWYYDEPTSSGLSCRCVKDDD